jgi:hypothetical protein
MHPHSPKLRLAAMSTAFMLSTSLGFHVDVASAARLDVPPVVISQLDHTAIYQPKDQSYTVRDFLQFPYAGPPPSTGYTSSGFSINPAGYDHVRVRFEAAPGLKFVVHALQPGEIFSFQAFWQELDLGDYNDYAQTGTLTFENGAGAVPTVQTYNYDSISDLAVAIIVSHQIPVNGDFEFTAIQIDFPAGHILPSAIRSFSPVQSNSAPSFSAGGRAISPDQHAIEMVSTIVTPALPTTWGRLKSIYR